MKWLLLGAIYLYRGLPARFKRQCLFKETCSSVVARVARECGFWPGLRALKTRVSQCRPGYLVYFDNEVKSWRVRFANGSISKSPYVADFVLDPYRDMSLQTWVTGDYSLYVRDESARTVVPTRGDSEALPETLG